MEHRLNRNFECLYMASSEGNFKDHYFLMTHEDGTKEKISKDGMGFNSEGDRSVHFYSRDNDNYRYWLTLEWGEKEPFVQRFAYDPEDDDECDVSIIKATINDLQYFSW